MQSTNLNISCLFAGSEKSSRSPSTVPSSAKGQTASSSGSLTPESLTGRHLPARADGHLKQESLAASGRPSGTKLPEEGTAVIFAVLQLPAGDTQANRV